MKSRLRGRDYGCPDFLRRRIDPYHPSSALFAVIRYNNPDRRDHDNRDANSGIDTGC